jgi:hypothetical protein
MSSLSWSLITSISSLLARRQKGTNQWFGVSCKWELLLTFSKSLSHISYLPVGRCVSYNLTQSTRLFMGFQRRYRDKDLIKSPCPRKTLNGTDFSGRWVISVFEEHLSFCKDQEEYGRVSWQSSGTFSSLDSLSKRTWYRRTENEVIKRLLNDGSHLPNKVNNPPFE